MMASLAAKRRLPILMSFYGRLRYSTCYFERSAIEIEKEGEKLGKMKKIYGPAPEDLEQHISRGPPRLRPGSVIPAPCISETKCLAAEASDFFPKHHSFVNLDANANPADILIHSIDKDKHPYFRAYSVDEEDGSLSPKYYMYPPYPIKGNWVFFGATCNGLFHFMNFMNEDSEHLLWNSATQEIKILPRSFVRTPRLVAYLFDSVMWFDHARQDYKLLQLVLTYAVDDQGDYTDRCYWIWWYSLQSNSWKKLPYTNFSVYTPVSACIDGVYYLAARLKDPVGAQAIMAFNLSTETLSKENLPSIDGDFWYRILEYKGLLSILVYPCTGYEPTKYELWVRKGEVWTRESVLHVSGVRHPTWFSKNGRLLYFESFKDEVVVFDRATGKWKNLGIHSHSKRLKFYPFAESFVRLNGVSVVEVNSYDS